MSSDLWGAWLESRARVRERRGLQRSTEIMADSFWIDLSSNDYLGLSRHPEVCQAAATAASEGPVGAGASRVVIGTHPVHQELESSLAELTGAASALVFSSGYTANLGALQSLGGPRCSLFLDEHVHASLRDAARLSGAHTEFFPHQDCEDLRQRLQTARRSDPSRRLAVVVESVYSVLGDAADLAALHRLCTEHQALLVVDEAHSIGLFPEGSACAAAGILGGQNPTDQISPRKTLAEQTLAGDTPQVPCPGEHHPEDRRPAPVLITATLSKALGAQGGALIFPGAPESAALWRDHVVNTARSFIFDTGLSPVAAAGALAALRTAVEQRLGDALGRRRALAVELLQRRPLLHQHLDAGAAAVISVRMPTPALAAQTTQDLAEQGIRVACFRPPSVPDGVARLRLTLHADHSPQLLARAVQQVATAVEKAWGAPTSCPFAAGDPRPATHRAEVLIDDPRQVRAVMTDPETFSPDNALITAVPLCPAARRILAREKFQLPPVLASASGPLHRTTRTIVQRFFTPRTLRDRLPRIQEIIEEEIAALVSAGEKVTDLSETLAAAVPARSIEMLTGVPNPPQAQLRRWSADSLELFWGWPEEARQIHLAHSAVQFYRWLRSTVASSAGSDNLFGRLLEEGISPEQVISLGYFLVIAGQETTRMLISIALDRALREEGQWATLADPDHGAEAATALIQDCLRQTSSVPTWRRITAAQTQLGDQILPAGTPLLLRLSGPQREDHRLAFGVGPHRCLGAGLAEMEATLVLHAVAQRFPQAKPHGPSPTWTMLLSFQAPHHVFACLGMPHPPAGEQQPREGEPCR